MNWSQSSRCCSICRANLVNIMAADALALCVARSSATIWYWLFGTIPPPPPPPPPPLIWKKHQNSTSLALCEGNPPVDTLSASILLRYHVAQPWCVRGFGLVHKFHNPTMHHSEQKCAHFCSEWCIVGFGTDALWDWWDWSIGEAVKQINTEPLIVIGRSHHVCIAQPKHWNCIHVFYEALIIIMRVDSLLHWRYIRNQYDVMAFGFLCCLHSLSGMGASSETTFPGNRVIEC